MIKNTIGASLLALGLVGATSSQAIPLVIENFEAQGNGEPTGVQTFTHPGYTYVNTPFSPNPGPGSLWAEGTLAEVVTSSSVHSLWFPTTTAFNGQMFLAVNGSTTPGQIAFRRSLIPVVAGLQYFFDSNLTALFPTVASATADLTFSVQYFNALNVAVGPAFIGGTTTPTVVGVWIPQSLAALAPIGATTATISLANSDIGASGNDFGVDYITFDTERQVPGVPEVSTGISAGAFALVGGLIVLRRRKSAQVA